MGYTELEPGNVWNTWPASPRARGTWSFATGKRFCLRLGRFTVAWASNYRFIWGMAGENRTFADMDPADLKELK